MQMLLYLTQKVFPVHFTHTGCHAGYYLAVTRLDWHIGDNDSRSCISRAKLPLDGTDLADVYNTCAKTPIKGWKNPLVDKCPG